MACSVVLNLKFHDQNLLYVPKWPLIIEKKEKKALILREKKSNLCYNYFNILQLRFSTLVFQTRLQSCQIFMYLAKRAKKIHHGKKTIKITFFVDWTQQILEHWDLILAHNSHTFGILSSHGGLEAERLLHI